MNKKQWSVLSIGLFMLGVFLLWIAPTCFLLEEGYLVSCTIRRYSLAIPGIIFMGLGIILSIINRYSNK
jgi:hypothetical protein